MLEEKSQVATFLLKLYLLIDDAKIKLIYTEIFDLWEFLDTIIRFATTSDWSIIRKIYLKLTSQARKCRYVALLRLTD